MRRNSLTTEDGLGTLASLAGKDGNVCFLRTIVYMIVAFTNPGLYAQATGGTGSAAGAKAVPASVLYWAFFGHVKRLDNTAAALQTGIAVGAVSATTKPANLRGYYKRRLGLADSEDAALHSVAVAFDAAVKQQDEAAKALIKNVRAQLRSANSSAATPQVPLQLIQMQTQRDSIVLSHINLLKAQMGAAGFQKVDAFVNTAFAIHASAQAIDPAVAKANAMTRLSSVELKGRKSGAQRKGLGVGTGSSPAGH